jgi:serine/threonine-protein kinase HipA
MTTALGIGLNGTIIGYLAQTKEGRITFRFTSAYLSMPNRLVLSQSFEDGLSRTYHGSKGSLPPFFANLIPEPGPLRELIESNLGINSGDDLALLEAVGRDLPGAVEIIRIDGEDFQPRRFQKQHLLLKHLSTIWRPMRRAFVFR